MREKLARFMAGRNGNDQLNLFLFAVDAVLLLAGALVGGNVGRGLSIAALALLAFIYMSLLQDHPACAARPRQNQNRLPQVR